MAYKFQSLPQLVDMRGLLTKKGTYSQRKTKLSDCTRAWHHSLTMKNLSGSDAASFARYHVLNNGWPGIAYHFVIEPKNIIQTAKGPRARVVYAIDVLLRSYQIGNSNDFGVGVCVAGDYRFEDLDAPTKATIDELQEMLVADKIGKDDKSHNEFPGYSWKACCVFDYKKQFKFLDHVPIDPKLPDYYTIQKGDTLFGLANNDDRFTVEDLMRWNDIEDPKELKVGQRITLKAGITVVSAPVKEPVKKPVAAPKVLWVGEVKADALTVRKGASTSYPAVTVLKKGDDVTVYRQEKNGWLYIGNGQYVSNVDGKYIGKKSTKYKYAGKRVEAIAAKVNFYNGQRWTNPSGQFTKGQGFIVIDAVKTEGSAQYKVKNSNGSIYYITARKDLVRIV